MKYFAFPYVCRPYQGKWTPENLAFNANLQDFAKQVRYIAELVNIGQLSIEEACNQIEVLLEELKHSKKHLGMGRWMYRS